MTDDYQPEHALPDAVTPVVNDNDTSGPQYWLSDKVYELLKWATLIALPAFAVLLNTILPLWGVPADTVKAIVVTINAIAVCAGALIGASQIKANSK